MFTSSISSTLVSLTSDSIASKSTYSNSCTLNNSLNDNFSTSLLLLKNSILSIPNIDTPKTKTTHYLPRIL